MELVLVARQHLYASLHTIIKEWRLNLLEWADFVMELRYVTLWFRFTKGMIDDKTYSEIKERVVRHLEKNRVGCHSVYLEDIIETRAIVIKLHCCY